MSPDQKDVTVAASAVDRNETASAFETGRGASPASPVDLSFLQPPQQSDEIGRLGSYRILSVLGHGGMGLVFRAEDPSLRRQVAVKVMLPRFATDLHARARFTREAQAQAAVEHDHIVPIYSVAHDHDPPFIVMPLLKGMTLADALKANARPPLPAIVRIGREIAEGLAAAHESGLIHRDIKPANIWLEGSKLRVRILDFGLARAATETDPAATGEEPLTADGAVVGTPMYMSPEQARGEHLDARTDNFSLGVILYQMATGELPFNGRTTASVLLAVVSHEPKGHETANLPPALSAIISRLLTKDRDAAGRPAAAAVIADELKQIEYGLAASAVQVVALDSIPGATQAPNPFAVLDTTAADETPMAAAVREPRLVGKAWLFGGIAALLAVVAAAGVMFKVMTKTDPPAVVKEDDPPAPPKPIVKPKDAGITANLDQRKALEAVLVMGGSIRLNGDATPIRAGSKLPPGTFQVAQVSLDDIPLDEAKLESLRALPPLGEGIGLKDTGIADAGLEKLASFPGLATLKHLNLIGAKITDDGLVQLQKFPLLKSLDLARTTITGRGLVHLRGMKLEWLNFHTCGNLTNDGIEHIADMTTLTNVWFMYTQVTQKGIAKLTKLENLRTLHVGQSDDSVAGTLLKFPLLEELNLASSKTTGKLLTALTALPKLNWLQVVESTSDADLAPLHDYPALGSLGIIGCGDHITDAGLDHLARCKRLSSLNAIKTKVTKAGAEALSEKLPLCKIEYDGGTVGPKDVNRLAAEKLRTHKFALTVRTPDGKEPHLKPTDPLPAGPFEVLVVTPPNEGTLPEDFVRAVLLPTIEPLPKLQYISDFWSVTTWSETDLAKLADSPVAANLYGLRGGFRLTPGAVASLKRIPNLGDLGCLVGSDEALLSLKELAKVSWLVLMAPMGKTHTIGPDGWAAVTGLKLSALELYGITIDAAAAKRIASLKTYNELHLTFASCPGALENLSEFRSSTSFRVMLFRAPLTDQDLPRFHPLVELRTLTLQTGGGTLTKAGVERLSERLPLCKIVWNGTTYGPKEPVKK